MHEAFDRKQFLLAGAATLAAATLPKLARADTGFSLDGQYVNQGFAIVRQVTFARTSERDAARLTFAMVSPNALKASIVQATQNQSLWQLAQQHHSILGINGGFFNTDFTYSGLLVLNGQQISPKSHLYDGAVVVDATGAIQLQSIDDVSNPQNAMQTGPFLIRPGGTMGIKSDDRALYARSFIAQSDDAIVLGMATTGISLYQLANILLQFPNAFLAKSFDSALDLGGASEASFFAQLPNEMIHLSGGANSPILLLIDKATP